MTATRGLLIVGFGTHAHSIADVAIASGFQELRFLEPTARDGEAFAGFPVHAKYDGPLPAGWRCIAAAGDNRARHEQMRWISRMLLPAAILVAPTATVGVGAEIGPGTFVGHHAHVGPQSKLGPGCIVNTGAVVEHDCTVGGYAHVSVNATVAGSCTIGSFVLLGAGSTVIDRCTVADDVIVGAGGVVTRSLERAGTYVGVPVRRLQLAAPREQQ
ncbi:MAG: NeuD/PglB/VioB family sugar acetyltransferase, partial [Xanthobacteraceae bacterium]